MRFPFGKNWKKYLEDISEDEVHLSMEHIEKMLGVSNLNNNTFLDAGSGSGLSSYAAAKLGADVTSFDYDHYSVNCTKELSKRHCNPWEVIQGSLLDVEFMKSLGNFDIVYSWGVLHHTGNLAEAMENVLIPLKDNGILYIALYNNQGWISKYWYAVKYLYNKNILLRYLMIFIHSPYLYFGRLLYRKLVKRQPLERGMHLWIDMLDWLGGFPFEVINPEKVIGFYKQYGLELKNAVHCGKKQGCNEFVFQKV